MKNTLLFFMLFMSGYAVAQQEIIGTPNSPEFKMMHGSDSTTTTTAVTADNPLTPYVLNVYFTIINDHDNHNSLNVQNILATPEELENKFQDCIKYLNTAFNPLRIYFKYKGYQEVQNQAIAVDGNWQFTFYSSTGAYPANDIALYKRTDSMNLIFFDTPSTAEFAYMGYNASLSRIGLLNSPDLEKTLVHKMAHNLSLFHTYEAMSHYQPSHPLYSFTSCEHVTRDTANPYYNANIAGDEVVDTAAQPVVTDANFNNSCGDYIGGGFDCYNQPFTGIVNGNYMNRLDISSVCTPSFTAGQTARMREFILNNPTVAWNSDMTINYFQGVVGNTVTTVESLYQPYSSMYVASEAVFSTTDNGDGTATVCRGRLMQHKFQKGFDYTFPENASPDPLTVGTDQIPIVKFHTFDYPVTIQQLAPGFTNLDTNTGTAYLSCTKGLLCSIEQFKSGLVLSTEILGSMNMSIQELNEMQVKDPNLYDNFMSHYYYIVKKMTETGAKTQEIFYKQ